MDEAMRDYLIGFDPPESLTIYDMGWTEAQALSIHMLFGAIAADWDDPAMDVYDTADREGA